MVPKSDCFAAGDADVDAAAAGAVVPSVVEAAAAPSTTATTAGAPSTGDAGTVGGGGVALSALLLSVSAAVTTGFVGADPFANDGLNAVTCVTSIDADRQQHSMTKNRHVKFGIIRVDAMIVFFCGS